LPWVRPKRQNSFASLGIPVFDSDAEVHRQYADGGEAVPGIAKAFPEAVFNGEVDRERLSRIVVAIPGAVENSKPSSILL